MQVIRLVPDKPVSISPSLKTFASFVSGTMGRKGRNCLTWTNISPPKMSGAVRNAAIIFSVFSFFFHRAFAQDFERVELQAGLGHIVEANAVSVADYDQDGDLDLFFTGFWSFDPDDEKTWNRLMKNNGDGTFEDVTLAAGFAIQFARVGSTSAHGDKLGASWGDYDNDGFPDLFLANIEEDQLYHNEGDGTFLEVTEQAGVAGSPERYSSGGLWWDHDRDGDLDLYVNNLVGANTMYDNRGDGTFLDVTEILDIGGFGVTWASVAIDPRRDGFLDLYNANDTQENQYFENPAGTYYNESSKAFALNDEGAGMGLTVADYNNDGFFDIYVSNIFNHHPNPLFTYVDGDNPKFEDRAEEMGVDNAGWGWGTKFFDCDHDGDEDLYVITGVMSKSLINDIEQQDEDNFFFKNLLIEDSESFQHWSVESAADGEARGRGFEVFDYDADGDLDMISANIENPPYLYQNLAVSDGQPSSGNWIQIWLEGTESNRNAFGTEVRITIDGKSYYRWHHGGAIFGQSIIPVHFGVGSAETIDEIKIIWPLGEVEALVDVPVNQTMSLKEGENGRVTGLEDNIRAGKFELRSYPNPFHSSTTLHFEIARQGSLKLAIYSITGKELYHSQQANVGPGEIEMQWNGKDLNGFTVPPGVYLYTVEFDDYHLNGKLLKIASGK